VTSTIQCGARNGEADAMNAFQSSRLAGANIFVPKGQLFLSLALDTLRQFKHFISCWLYVEPEAIATLSHLQPSGLPGLGLDVNFTAWQ